MKSGILDVLVVDDDPTIRLFLSSVLRSWEYQVIEAADGREAQEILRDRPVPWVLCDWNMTELTGVQLCRWLRNNPSNSYTYFILLTGRNDKESLIEGMEAGADDFLVKPIDTQELRVRMRAGERVLLLQQQLAERNRLLEQINKELQVQYDNLCRDVESASRIYANLCQDIEAAAKLQQSLLPAPAAIGSFRSEWLFVPAAQLAGDMFGYYALDDRHLGFFQIDVSGHGIPAALFSFSVSQSLTPAKDGYGFLKRPLSKPPFYTLTSPATVARELNRHFASTEDTGIYFTLAYGLLDQESGEATLVQAGHPYPLHWHCGTGHTERIGSGGYVVGMLPGLEYETVSFTVDPGDRLFLYSDGIVECSNPEGELYGLERLEVFIGEHGQRAVAELISHLRNELQAWRGGSQFDDDISLLVIERSPVA